MPNLRLRNRTPQTIAWRHCGSGRWFTVCSPDKSFSTVSEIMRLHTKTIFKTKLRPCAECRWGLIMSFLQLVRIIFFILKANSAVWTDEDRNSRCQNVSCCSVLKVSSPVQVNQTKANQCVKWGLITQNESKWWRYRQTFLLRGQKKTNSQMKRGWLLTFFCGRLNFTSSGWNVTSSIIAQSFDDYVIPEFITSALSRVRTWRSHTSGTEKAAQLCIKYNDRCCNDDTLFFLQSPTSWNATTQRGSRFTTNTFVCKCSTTLKSLIHTHTHTHAWLKLTHLSPLQLLLVNHVWYFMMSVTPNSLKRKHFTHKTLRLHGLFLIPDVCQHATVLQVCVLSS